MSYSRRLAAEQRRRNWRLILITIIIVTIPFYCAGVFLWGTAAPRVTPTPIIPTTAATQIPSTAGPSPTPNGFEPSITPLALTIQPTGFFPTDIVPPTLFPTLMIPTRYLSPTPPPPPTATNPPPPTDVPPPPVTDTPIPFESFSGG